MFDSSLRHQLKIRTAARLVRIFYMKKNSPPPILGHDIPKARLTPLAWMWIAIYLGVPVVVVGSLLDAITSWLTGRCTAWWCLF